MTQIFDQLLDAASSSEAERAALEESPMGLFQAFRQDGLGKCEFLDAVEGGAELRHRLERVFRATGAGRRSDGMKDAYFIVRSPPTFLASAAQTYAEKFVSSALALLRAASSSMQDQAFELIAEQASGIGEPKVRILEGKAPKHPRRVEEQSLLMRLLTNSVPEVLASRHADASLGYQLAEPLYYLACDGWLREFVRWPLARANSEELEVGGDEAVAAYFELWRHGVKFRIFGDSQVDFYLPHRDDGSLIDAGQFAFRRN